ncbi:MAG: VaFE repeat-containing surface-anchored protein, partial [Parasporobacterium sp.]|nr:VaFE repeat-containing surface-anchored protein [Parasporobacterium sp.]
LYDTATGTAVGSPQTVNFTAEAGTAAKELTYNLTDVKSLKGKAYTAVATLEAYANDGWTVMAEEKDMSNTQQTISFPSLGTTLTDPATGEHIAAPDSVLLTDTVTYEGLIPGTTYTLNASLTDKDTKDVVGTGTTVFTATESSGTAEVEITVTLLPGHTYTCFEELYDGTARIAAHEDPEDEDQTVHVPGIKTTLKDADGAKEALASNDIKLTDTVTYTNLTPGKEYKILGKLCDKETGLPLLDDNGSEITAEVFHTPETASGSVDITFTFPGVTLAGKKIVAFETVTYDDVEVAVHAEIDDEDQTVDIPEIGTTLTDSDGEKDASGEDTIVLTDTVAYNNLTAGKEYKITGKLYDKETGEPAQDDSGAEITAEALFTPDSESGSAEVTFTFVGTNLKGHSVVAFEEVYHDGKLLAVHAELDDEDQTVYIPKMGTTLYDPTDEGKDVYANGVITLIDRIAYENLIPGTEYTAVGILYDKATDTPALDDSGNKITTTKVFTAADAAGTVDIEFTFPAETLAGKSLVAIEGLYRGGKIVAIHGEIGDAEQTVDIPAIKTTLVGKNSGLHSEMLTETVTLIDTVTYTNLIVGKEYTIKGTLMDKHTGEAYLDAAGNRITASETFTAQTADGSVDITFVIENVPETGFAVVAFEDLYRDNKLVAVHADITDEDQTVFVSNLCTTLRGEGGLKVVDGAGTVVLTDTVDYSGLIPGRTYTLKGQLMDKNTGKEALDASGNPITAETVLVPETTDGSAQVVFTFECDASVAREAVAFEYLYLDGTEIASHAELGDIDQMVTILNLKTTAAFADGTKSASGTVEQKVKDVISYSMLVPGTYRIKTTLVRKSDGQPILTATADAAIKDASGEVTVEMTVPAGSYYGDAVIFEEFYLVGEDGTETEVGHHTDINDASQTITLTSPSTPPDGPPKTGDESSLMLFASLAGMALITIFAAGLFLLKKREH